VSGKIKCIICAAVEFQNILCGRKKMKHEALGCRVGKKSAVKFTMLFYRFDNLSVSNGCCVGVTLAYNVLRLGEGRDFYHKT
jgi:hypothetical protein